MPKKKQTLYYNGAAIRPRRGGWQADIMRGNQRYRRQFPDGPEGIAAAKRYIDTIHVEYMSDERSLTVLETNQAREALKLLPAGVNLLQAAEFYVERHHSVKEKLSLQDAVDRYLAAKVKMNLRPRSITGPRQRLNKLAGTFPHSLVTDLAASDLLGLLDDLGVAGQTWNNYRADWSAFWNWCIARECAAENPARRIEEHRVDDDVPEFFPVADAKNWFAALEAQAPELIPYYALSFFAGVRTAELQRMTGELITPELIRVTTENAKTRDLRNIQPWPTLHAWLKAYPPGPGPLLAKNHRNRAAAVRASIKGFQWVANGGRKSWATYGTEYSQNPAEVAYIMGHKSPDLLYNTYRGLTTRAEAVQYFAIRPKR
jgi:hypothetical protein